MLNVTMLNVIKLRVIMLSVLKLRVTMLSVIMLSVIMLSVIMLIVVKPNIVMLIVVASLQRIYSKRMKIKSCRMSGQFQIPSVRLIQNTVCPVEMNKEILLGCYDLNVFQYIL
jgi:hypothetical protein